MRLMLFLCLLAVPVISTCSECCSNSTCTQAFQGTNGVCCGRQGGGFACCPTGSICKSGRNSWSCSSSNQRSYSDSVAGRTFSWFYILLMTLLPCLCISAVIAMIFRMVNRNKRTHQPVALAPPPYSSNPAYPAATNAYPTSTTTAYPTADYHRGGGGYGAAGMLGAGALGLLGGAALGSAMDGGGGDFGGVDGGGFAPDVDFAAGI